MAAIIQDFVGFDHNDVNADHRIDSAATASCSIINIPAPLYGPKCLEITPSKTLAYFRAGDEHTFTADGITLFAAYLRVSGTTPPPAANPAAAILAVLDENSTAFVYVRLDDAFNLELYDSKDNLLDAIGLFVNQWRRVDILFQHNLDAANPGDWAWSVQAPGIMLNLRAGTPAFGETDAKADFSDPTGTKQAMWLGGQGGEQPVIGGDMDVQHCGAYISDDVTGTGDAVGIKEGKTGDFVTVYTDGKLVLNSDTPECDEYGTTTEDGFLQTLIDVDNAVIDLDNADHNILTTHTVDLSWAAGARTGMDVTASVLEDITVDGGAGDNLPAETTRVTVDRRVDLLDTGTWDDAGDNNLATECTYTLPAVANITKGGGVRVPAPLSRQADRISAVKFIYFYKSPNMGVVHGYWDGTSYVVSYDAASVALAAYEYHRIIEDWPVTIGEFARTHKYRAVMGIRMISSGRDARTLQFAEADFGTLQAVPVVTGKPTIGKTANVSRGKRPWH